MLKISIGDQDCTDLLCPNREFDHEAQDVLCVSYTDEYFRDDAENITVQQGTRFVTVYFDFATREQGPTVALGTDRLHVDLGNGDVIEGIIEDFWYEYDRVYRVTVREILPKVDGV